MDKHGNHFDENSLGVHLRSPTGMDVTLCGVALEGDMPELEPCTDTRKTVVTCPKCAKIINACKHVRVAVWA